MTPKIGRTKPEDFGYARQINSQAEKYITTKLLLLNEADGEHEGQKKKESTT